MMRAVLVLVACTLAGCSATRQPFVARGQFAEGRDDKPAADTKPAEPAKTLFTWAVAPPKDDDAQPEETAPGAIVTDRPDFTEASSTVGLGRAQLEAGFTYNRDRSAGIKSTGETYPEMLLRVGAFAEWFELRLGQTYARSNSGGDRTAGFLDTYIGAKLGLTEQADEWPEMAIILQATLPTGAREFTTDQVNPGFNFLYGWEVIPDFLSAAGSLGANRAVDGLDHSFVVLSQSFTVGYTLTEKVGAYTEWFALYPTGAVEPGVGPQHYANGGFTYKVTPDFQLDVRAGVGLNDHANDFFGGVGFAVRY